MWNVTWLLTGTLRIATLVTTLNHRQGCISRMECTNAHKRHTITHIHITYTDIHTCTPRGGSRILGKGGSDKYIHNWGRVREGACPSRDSKGVWGEAPAAFLLLRLFSMKLTVISINTYTYTSRDIRITRACMDSDEKTVHSSQCYIVPTAQQLNS